MFYFYSLEIWKHFFNWWKHTKTPKQVFLNQVNLKEFKINTFEREINIQRVIKT